MKMKVARVALSWSTREQVRRITLATIEKTLPGILLPLLNILRLHKAPNWKSTTNSKVRLSVNSSNHQTETDNNPLICSRRGTWGISKTITLRGRPKQIKRKTSSQSWRVSKSYLLAKSRSKGCASLKTLGRRSQRLHLALSTIRIIDIQASVSSLKEVDNHKAQVMF